jgi:hypothetical protein
MWHEIEATVSKSGLLQSVYADDITVSGSLVRKEVIWEIKRSIDKHGLKVKAEKELSLIHSPADITGVIVHDNRTKLPNRQHQKLFELRGARHRAKSAQLKRMLDSQIAGRMAQRRQVEQR